MADIEHDCSILVEWFRDNYLTLNADKCHLIVSGYKYEAMFDHVFPKLYYFTAKLSEITVLKTKANFLVYS